MATVNYDMKEDSMHSVFLDSVISNLDDDALSPEDLAWADSCLNKEVDASDADWSSIKDALLEIISSQSESPANFSAAQSSMEVIANEAFRSRENLSSGEFGRGSDEDEDLLDEDDDFGEVESIDISEDDGDDFVSRNKRLRMRGKNLNNVFRPNYSEDVKVEDLDSGLSSSLYEVDTSLQSIFQVWDLGVSDEQDDFTKQLNKAIDDGPSQIQSISFDSAASKDQMHVSMDDLIAGIDGLSLKQNTK